MSFFLNPYAVSHVSRSDIQYIKRERREKEKNLPVPPPPPCVRGEQWGQEGGGIREKWGGG